VERLREHYSHSRLSTFENCPRQFHFRYVRRVPARWESIESFVGKRVHEVLERLQLFVGSGRVPTLAAVLRRYRQLWDEHYDAGRVRVVREDEPLEQYLAYGERCLSNHYRAWYPFDADETLGLEQRVTVDLDGAGQYRLQGFVDRIARARDGAVEIHDYKTARRIPRQEQLDRDRQLALYQMGVAGRFPEARGFRLVWHYLCAGRTRVSTRTPEQLERLRGDTIGLIDRIESEREFAPKTGPLCRWCEYRELCDASPHHDPALAAELEARRAEEARKPREPSPAAPGAQLGLFGPV